MAKKTELEIIDLITGIEEQSPEFLEEYEPQKSDKQSIENYYEQRELAQNEYHNLVDEPKKDYENAEKEYQEFLGKHLRYESKYDHHEGGRDGDIYYHTTFYFNGKLLYSTIDISDSIDGLSVLKNIVSDYERKQQEYNYLVNDPKLVEYNNILDEIEKLEKTTGFFAKMAAKSKIKKLKLRLGEIYPKVERYNYLTKFLEEKNQIYNEVKEFLSQVADFEKTKKELYDIYNAIENDAHSKYSKYLSNQDPVFVKQAKQRIADREKNAKNFMLIKLFKENEKDFENTRKTLKMIYSENTSKEFQRQFNDLSEAYDKAILIAKEEGKNFGELKPEEQFEYFEAAQKVLSADKNFGKDDIHK